MSRNIYNFFTFILLPFAVLRLLIKSFRQSGYRHNIGQRFGFFFSSPRALGMHHPIWLHCVSVGELRGAHVLIEQLSKTFGKERLLITTTTPTGKQMFRQLYGDTIQHYYFPFDNPLVVNRWLKQIRPSICVLLETEIWPNLIDQLAHQNIPVILANARLSERSKNKYQRFSKKLSQEILEKLTVLSCQTQSDVGRFIELGSNVKQTHVGGNLKFDPSFSNVNTELIKPLFSNRKAVVFASTHEDEERRIIHAYKQLPIDALLVFIPRHPERFEHVFRLLTKAGLSVVKRSYNQPVDQSTQALLVDSMGEVLPCYALAEIAFVGGSLIPRGGHNMLEAASLAKPVVFGESVFNFSENAAALENIGGAIKVSDEHSLMKTLQMLLAQPERCKDMGERAKQFCMKNRGASQRLADLIAQHV